MRVLNLAILLLCIFLSGSVFATKPQHHQKAKHTAQHVNKRKKKAVHVAEQKSSAPSARSIRPSELAGFDRYPSEVKKLITSALELSDQHLAYKFGSMDPKNNGMDCSGTIQYLLKQFNVNDAPRQADEIYKWTWKKGEFFAVNAHKLNSFEFSELKPGHLLFWSGTYPVKRDPAVTHVMMYLGKDKQNRPLMFGATTGRLYAGKIRNGVGVFDFKLPSAQSKARFLGYACIPGISCDF